MLVRIHFFNNCRSLPSYADYKNTHGEKSFQAAREHAVFGCPTTNMVLINPSVSSLCRTRDAYELENHSAIDAIYRSQDVLNFRASQFASKSTLSRCAEKPSRESESREAASNAELGELIPPL